MMEIALPKDLGSGDIESTLAQVGVEQSVDFSVRPLEVEAL
jgi:hypothetical protein